MVKGFLVGLFMFVTLSYAVSLADLGEVVSTILTLLAATFSLKVYLVIASRDKSKKGEGK